MLSNYDNIYKAMKLNVNVNSAQIIMDLKALLKFIYILFVSLLVFLVFSILYGIENLIKITYILTKPKFIDLVAIHFLGNIVDILPFVVIFSLAYFAYKLNYGKTSDVIRLSVIVGMFVYLAFFVVILLSPRIDKLVLEAHKNFSTSDSSPKYLFNETKINFVGNEKVIPTRIYKNTFDGVIVKDGRFRNYSNLRVVPYDSGIKVKSLGKDVVVIPYEKIIPSSFGKLYEYIYRGFLKVATQFPLTRYVQKFGFSDFLNLMLYVQALAIGIMYVVWLFRDYSTTKVILLSVFVSVMGITVVGFLSSVFEFMKLSSYLEFVKDIVSGLLAIALAILIVMGSYKVDQILKGRVG